MAARSGVAGTLLGYEPIIDRTRKVIALRLTARAIGGAPIDVAVLYSEIATLWQFGAIPVLLSVECDALPAQLIEQTLSRRVWLEVPPAMTVTPEGAELITKMQRRGFVLMLGGRPPSPLSKPLMSMFRMSIIDVQDERRASSKDTGDPHVYTRSIPYAHSAVSSISTLKNSFEHGALACVGWPFDDVMQHAVTSDASPDFATIASLLSMIDADVDMPDLEKTIRGDAALAYRLLRYINSAAFGLGVEIQSFRHAVMMLGYNHLKRWLLPMLTTASKDANMRPVMFASLRRGLFLENLAGSDSDSSLRDELFILGVLSLLDKLFSEPLPALLDRLNVSSAIREALLDHSGPYAAYLRIAEAIEHEPGESLAGWLDEAFVSVEQCNRALIKALTIKELSVD